MALLAQPAVHHVRMLAMTQGYAAHRGSVEPYAGDHVEDNLTTVGRLYYGASTMICCAHAISEGGRLVLGAQAGPERLAEVFRKAGLSRFRRAAETQFNLVMEIRR